jgi:excisionase family DNA binding protein
MPSFVKVGQVVRKEGISVLVQFQGHAEPTAIPDAYMYWHPTPPAGASLVLTKVSAPKVEVSPADGPSVSVRQAAALLGVTSKDVRRMLRSGRLTGTRKGRSWAGVEQDSLSRLRRAKTPSTG